MPPLPKPAPHPLAAPIAIAAGLAAFCLYAWLALPTTYLLDSTEFIASTVGMGVSHPPGHPSYHLATRLAMWLPIGSIAVRIHLASALSCAVAIGLLVHAAGRWGWLRTPGHLVTAFVVALLVATAPGIAFHAIRAEVYGLQLLVVASLVWLLARTEGAPSLRESAIAGVLLGVGLLNHHYLLALFAPALVVAIGAMLRAHPAAVLGRTGVAVLASALLLPGYAYLVAVGATDAQATWGWPSSFGDVWWFVSAETFQGAFVEPTRVPLGERIAALFALLMAQIGPTAFLFGAVGAGLLLKRQPAPGLLLVFGVATNLVSVVGREPQPENPDIAGYLMGSVWLIGLAAIYGANAVVDDVSRRRAVPLQRLAVAGTLGLLLAGAWPRGHVPAIGGAYWQSDALRRGFEHDAPPDARFASSYFETLFNAWFGREVYDARPDIALVPRALLTHELIRRDATRKLAGAEALDGSDGLTLAPSGDRAILVEVERIVPRSELRCGVVDGFLLRVTAECRDPLPDEAACAASFLRAVDRLPRPLEQQTARNVMWAGWNLANAMCATERPLCCAALVESVLPISPADPDLLALRNEAQRAISARASGASRPE